MQKRINLVNLGDCLSLSNAYLLANFGFDTAEDEPCKVCPIERCSQPHTDHDVNGRTADDGDGRFRVVLGLPDVEVLRVEVEKPDSPRGGQLEAGKRGSPKISRSGSQIRMRVELELRTYLNLRT